MKTIIVAMSATDSVHIIRELQRLVTNDGRVEQHICALWANAIQPFGARGSAVLAELQGSLTVLNHSQSPLVGQTIPMPQTFSNGLAALAAPMPKGWHVLQPSSESEGADRFYLALELHDHELSNPEFCAHITSLGTLCHTLIWAAQLKRQNTLFSSILDSMNYGIAVSDAQQDDYPLVYVNPAFEALTGYAAEEILGQNCRFMSAEPPDSHVLQNLRNTIRKHEAGGFTLRNTHKSGREFLNQLSIFPISTDGNSVSHLAATQADVTEQANLLAEMKRSQSQLNSVLNHTNDAFLMLSADQKVLFANAATQRMFPAGKLAWKAGTAFAQNWQRFTESLPNSVKPLAPEFEMPDLIAFAQQGTAIPIKTPDGRRVLVRAELTAEGGIVLSASDVTALFNAERMLRQRAAAIENASEGIGITDSEGRILYGNSSLAAMLGKDSEIAILGRKWHQNYRSSVQQDLANAAQHGTIYERDNETGEVHYHEITQTEVDHVGTVIVVRDVTRRVEAQRTQDKLNLELGAAQKSQAVSTLAAGLAHDFNNLISAINGSAQLIGMGKDVDQATAQHAKRILSAGNQASFLVNQLLTLGREIATQNVFDFRSALNEAQDLIRPSLHDQTILDVQPGPEPLDITGNLSEASQVLVNLILNADDALAGQKGAIKISLSPACFSQSAELSVGQLQSNVRYLCILISDSGHGMTPETMSKIWEPYFSTKGEKGTGLGLSSTAQVVQQAGGAIALESQPDHGTVFRIYWPLAQQDASQPCPETADLSGATILVVDDDAKITDVVGAYLERCGAEVGLCNDPHLALETLEEDPESWDVLITDFNMPDMHGAALIDRINELAIKTKIIVLSSVEKSTIAQDFPTLKYFGHLSKPVDLRRLGSAVQNCINNIIETLDENTYC